MPTFTLNGEPLAYGGFSLGEGEELIKHPANVLDTWSDEDLAALGIVRTPDPPAPEPGTPRRLIAKSLIHERVNAIGKLDEALAALNASPIHFARWFSPDWPSVYFDDPDMVALLEGVGCTAEQIDAITAA